jgi:NDP-sugar pyrophosphorylase family protein
MLREDFERGLGEVRVKCVASLYDVYYKVTEVVIVRMDLRHEQEEEQEQEQEQEQVLHTSEKSVKGTAGLLKKAFVH